MILFIPKNIHKKNLGKNSKKLFLWCSWHPPSLLKEKALVKLYYLTKNISFLVKFLDFGKKLTKPLLLNTAGKLTFTFHSAKIITPLLFILPKLFANPPLYSNLTSLKHIISIKNHNNVVNCDFAIPALSDCWKSFIRSIFSGFF